MSQIDAPFPYFGDPTKSRALFNAQLYFGVPDTDPAIASNQKLVRAIQEDGIEVSLSQPVETNSGGFPTYNGSPVRLSISGNYSFKAFNRSGTLVLEASDVENVEPGSEGFSGIVVKEEQTLSLGQTTVTFSNIGANESVFYLQTTIGDQGFLLKDTDYTVTNSTTIELTGSYNAGDIVVGRQNDPTGQLVPVTNTTSIYVYDNISAVDAARIAGDITNEDVIFMKGDPSAYDGNSGLLYRLKTAVDPNDGVNFIGLTGGYQLELITNYQRFKNYSEEIGTASIASGIMTVDLSGGVVQQIELTENVTDINFTNFNPDSSYSSSVTLKIAQDAVGSRTLAWPTSIEWSGGTSPTMTGTALAEDIYVFITYDGSTWYGHTAGQDYS